MVVMNIGKDATLLGFTLRHNHLLRLFISPGLKNLNGLFPTFCFGQGILTICKGCAGLITQLFYICRCVVHNVFFLLYLTVVFYSDADQKYSYLCPFFWHPSA